MKKDGLKLGLALSGGGIRATIFHLGILKFLAEAGLFNRIASISSVSGASLCIGLVLAKNNLAWPSGPEYLDRVLPEIEKTIMENNIQRSVLLDLPFSPKYWWNRVELLARVVEQKWGIYGNLQELPALPYWEINCTTYETGKSFRIRRDYMGDFKTGYTQNPGLSIANVIAASAGFPALIGPYRINARGYRWTSQKWEGEELAPLDDYYHLWDGGVYDNLGLEALYKIGRGLDAEINYLLVCDASASIAVKKRKPSLSPSNLKRLLDIAMDQVGSLRCRNIYSYVVKQNEGAFIKIGNSAAEISESGGLSPDAARELISSCMTAEQALSVQNYPTTLTTPTAENFSLILRHGYENAKCVYACYMKEGAAGQ
ncbi:patatin-like phospholipase family protein [Brucepastera parasyntrophica]|uniref:patatin-like phospholipase family protein n=1 Tax=Brucepastera parasyntrophica TaxID=2880008 RepID=UPI00210F1B8D|nr:patatin-like phospholipase family protein [Brucepastera parasyntrophica]ULQ59394.1 patatin-like phospholipase family protein [Brucepastera parasyntrophica]